MPADRFFINSFLNDEQELFLEDTEFHHLAHVMRMKEGEVIELVNGQGALAQATLKQLEKKRALLTIDSVVHQPKNQRELILAQALPRINRLDFIIEKGTELGATQFWLFPGQHSERKILTDHQLERLESQAIAAMKQCGSLFLPKLEFKPSLDRWEKLKIPAYFGDTRPTAEPFSQMIQRQESVLFFVGPEAGFSEKEIQRLIELGARGVKLHENILRTDTAALAALCMMSL
jgi:16S rRNA (uracil1498-N3)-methyltransferase